LLGIAYAYVIYSIRRLMNTTVTKGSLAAERMSERRDLLLVAALIIMTAAAYWPSTVALWDVWADPDLDGGHAHGPLVGLLALWMLFRSRAALARAPLRPAPWAFPFLLMGGLASLVFWRAGIQSLHMLLLPALAVLTVLCVLGTEVARAVAFPLGYLYFSMPIWGLLAPLLRQLTSHAVAVLSPLVGIPAQVAGNVVNLPRVGAFEITLACSGINFLVIGLAVAALIGELTRASMRRRIWLLAVMGAGAIASNWLRALLIIGIGYATDLRVTLATRDHLLFGWIIFAAVLLGYVWWATAQTAGVGESPPNSAADPAAPTGRANYGPALMAATLVLCAAPTWVYIASPRLPGAATLPLAMPDGRPGWQGPRASLDPLWGPIFIGTHTQQTVAYQHQGVEARTVEVLVVGYARQGQGEELVNEGNSLLGDRGLTAISGDLARAGGQTFRELTVVDGQGKRSVIWSAYDIGGRTFVTPLYSQLWYALRSFSGTPYSALIAFRTSCEPSCGQARAALQSFTQVMGAQLLKGSLIFPPHLVQNRDHAGPDR
jgi:EpsI family protein